VHQLVIKSVLFASSWYIFLTLNKLNTNKLDITFRGFDLAASDSGYELGDNFFRTDDTSGPT